MAGRDLLRLAHPKAADLGKRKREEDVEAMNMVLHFVTHPADEVRIPSPSLLQGLFLADSKQFHY